MILYFDTSALVKLFIAEAGSGRIVEGLANASGAATSVVAYAECRSAFARRKIAGDLESKQVLALVNQLDETWVRMARAPVSEQLAKRAGRLAEVHTLRGFDAVHLASALEFQRRYGEITFLCFDDRLNTAAVEAGLALYGEEPAARS